MPRLFAQPSFDRVERQSMVDWFFFCKLERRIREIFEVLILLSLLESNFSSGVNNFSLIIIVIYIYRSCWKTLGG